MSPTDPLAQLEGFLAQDPGNNDLRAEAFDTALRLGRRDRAEAHLAVGLANGVDTLAWQLRQAHWWMAQHDWAAASEVLAALLSIPGAPAGLDAAVRHDLALVSLRTGHADDGLAALAPLMHSDMGSNLGTDAPPAPALQALWLRLKHHTDQLDDLLACAKRWASAHGLGAEAAGVASLAALDAGELALSDAWSREALGQLPRQMEALVSQGSLALARQSAADAKGWLTPALQLNPQDGRAWSAWAFAQMLAGELADARTSFDTALRHMPEHIGTWHGLGWVNLFLGDLAGAQSAFSQALALDRNFAESHGGLAVVLARQGQRAQAEAAIEIAMRLDRQCMSAHYAQAVLDGRADDPAELQRLATRLFTARQDKKPAR